MQLLPTPIKQFKFANVNYDNEKGIDNIPDSLNIVYKGFTCVMTAVKFLNLTPDRTYDEESSFKFQLEAIKSSKAIGCPFLDIDFKPKTPIVTSHEGRTRVKAIETIFGSTHQIIVHVFGRSEYNRAKKLDGSIIDKVRQKLVREKTKKEIKINNFDKMVYLYDKWINLEAGG